MENGLVSPSVEGTPQGGPFSPLLSNLVLDELDRELERRGHRFVRYADDCNIYVRSERAGQRVMKSISRFITQKLKLKVNQAKSAVARPQERRNEGSSGSASRPAQISGARSRRNRWNGSSNESGRSHEGPNSLGPAAIARRSVAAVENTASPSCGTDRTASLRGVAQYGRQRPWPLAHRPEQSPLYRAFQRLLQIARSPVLDRSALA
jgi:hypothetical protein